MKSTGTDRTRVLAVIADKAMYLCVWILLGGATIVFLAVYLLVWFVPFAVGGALLHLGVPVPVSVMATVMSIIVLAWLDGLVFKNEDKNEDKTQPAVTEHIQRLLRETDSSLSDLNREYLPNLITLRHQKVSVIKNKNRPHRTKTIKRVVHSIYFEPVTQRWSGHIDRNFIIDRVKRFGLSKFYFIRECLAYELLYGHQRVSYSYRQRKWFVEYSSQYRNWIDHGQRWTEVVMAPPQSQRVDKRRVFTKTQKKGCDP